MSDYSDTKEIKEIIIEKNTAELTTRRNFLRSLGKWSAVIIGTVTAANMTAPKAAGWVNGRGGAWVNGRGGGSGGAWINGSGGSGGGGSWVNGGGDWVNARGGGAWINRR